MATDQVSKNSVRVLAKTPARDLPRMVAVLTPESDWVTTRGDCAAWLRGEGLSAAATEVMHRRVAPGQALMLLIDDAGPRFKAVQLVGKRARSGAEDGRE